MTTHPSMRAEARRRTRAAIAAEQLTPAPATETPLTAQLRSLYEDTAVPVREIARLAGVTERTIYKIAAKQGWRPRVVRLSRGGGGRFVPLAERDKPVARGLAALDPARAAQAAETCRRAGALSQAVIARVVAEHEERARLRVLNILSGARAMLAGLQDKETPAALSDIAARAQLTILDIMHLVLAPWAGIRFNLPQSRTLLPIPR